jgi:hypothetical protein
MAVISRRERAEMARRARDIYRARARAGDTPGRIAAEIAAQLPHLLPLEVWRLAHGWTRAQVVERVRAVFTGRGLPAPGLTEQMLCRWEHGVRSPSAEYEAALCRVYGVERDQLRHGVGPGQDGGDDPMRRRVVLATAATTIPASLLLAFDDALDVPPEVERPEDLPQIRRRLAEARRLWEASALTALMAALPGTLAVAREAAERLDTPAAWALAAAVHDVATDLLNKIGHKPAARITADRSVMMSARSDNAVAMGASARALGMMLRTTGRFPQALRVVDGAAGRLESAGLRTPGEVGMYVRLMCTAAYTLGGAGDRPRAFERLGEAERAARRLPPGQAEVALPFVKLYQVTLNRVLGDPGAGLRAGLRLREEMYPTPERRGRFWTDIARVAWPVGDVEQTVQALRAACAYAPAEVRDRPSVRAIAVELVERYPRADGVGEVAAVIGHRHT